MKKLLLGLIALTFLFLTGCAGTALMALEPIITGAIVGSDIHGAMASTKLKFVEEKQEGALVFQKIAIWPDNQCEVYVADNLITKGITVATPSTVRKIIRADNLEDKLINLTLSEELETFKIICQKTKADVILGARGPEIIIYSLSQNKIIWSARIAGSYIKNSTQDNLYRQIASLLAEKIIALKNNFSAKK